MPGRASHFPTIRPDLVAFVADCSYFLDLLSLSPFLLLACPGGFLTVAKYAESRKISKYSSIIASCTSSFVLFSIEPLGLSLQRPLILWSVYQGSLVLLLPTLFLLQFFLPYLFFFRNATTSSPEEWCFVPKFSLFWLSCLVLSQSYMVL